MKTKTILITGAFGFVGNNISQYLRNKSSYKLIALDIKSPDVHSYDVFYNWEQLNNIEWNSIDTIIHLAGKAHDTKEGNEAEYNKINVGLTENIFNFFKNNNIKKFIYFSSVKAVADTVTDDMLTEDVVPNPQTPYGKSKLKAENYILSQKLDNEKKVYIIRPCMIHGPGNKGNLNLLYKLVQKGIPYPLGAFNNSRSFTSIGNLSYVIEQIIIKDVESGIYQMADDDAISTKDLIILIANSMNKKEKIIPKGKSQKKVTFLKIKISFLINSK